MLGDAVIDLEDSGEGLRSLPQLSPVPVATQQEVDELVRSARAGVAMLSLQLRTAQNDASLAERELPRVDLLSAHELVRSSLERHLSARRRELAEDLDKVRSDAAASVTAARTEAAELVAAATEETRQILLRGLHPVSSIEPGLRVVPDDDAGAASSDPARRPSAETLSEADLLEAQAAPPVAIEHRSSIATTMPEPVSESVPDLRLRLDVPVQAALAHLAAAQVPAVTSGHSAPLDDERRVLDIDAPASPVLVAPRSPETHDQTTSDADEQRPSRGALSRFLYVDVLLPMIAALIVLVILLAWVG